jgi:hypothetical protein
MTAASEHATPPALPESAIEHIFGHLCRHVVCLAFQFVALDERGKPTGMEQFMACSAFIMQIRGIWLLITAGHVLKEELDDNVARRKIRITSCVIADDFGKDAKVHHMPTPFPYEETHRDYVDDPHLGLDVGLIPLRDIFRDGLTANGILPISEANWVHQHRVDFEMYFILGFPKEIVDQHTKPVDLGQAIQAHVKPVLVKVHQITDPSQIPSTVEIPPSSLPWFVGRIPDTQLNSIKGMSGGPIIGTKGTPDGGFKYWIVALQSRWYEKSRIALGCPVPIFAELIGKFLEGKPHSPADLPSPPAQRANRSTPTTHRRRSRKR